MELHGFIAEVKNGEQTSVSKAVDFVIAESLGMWHNRARAKLCRHFKNHPPTPDQQTRLVESIAKRLITGRFYEQFKDQLAMAIRFCPARMSDAAAAASQSERPYVQKYAEWVQHRVALDAKLKTQDNKK